MVRAIGIPETSPRRCISFGYVPSLRCPGESTGDWQFDTAWLDDPDGLHGTARIGGQGGLIDTAPALGDRGVRDMDEVLAAKRERVG